MSEPANCRRSEGRRDSEKASQCEQIGGCRAGASTTHDVDVWCVSINDLPDEILIKILSHMSFSELMDVVQKVCTRWKRLSQDFKLWTDKEYEVGYWKGGSLHSIRLDITDEEAVRTFCAVPNLRKVRLSRCAPSRVFRALYNNCHWLTELHLHPLQKLSYSVLKNLVENCPRIRILSIHNGLLKEDKFVEAVSRLCELRVLIVHSRREDTFASLRGLVGGCPLLAEVYLRRVEVEIDDLRDFLTAKRSSLVSLHINWQTLGERCVTPLLAECANNLERLELYNFSVDNVKREMFTALRKLSNLRELVTIIDYKPPISAALAFESGGLQNLRRLDLDHGHGLEDDSVIAISRGCPALRELLLRCCTLLSDAAFSQIHRLKCLEMLDVSCCRGLGGGVLPQLARLPQLRTLLLEDLDFPKLQPGVASLLELPGLRRLSLEHSIVTGVPFDEFPGKLVSLR